MSATDRCSIKKRQIMPLVFSGQKRSTFVQEFQIKCSKMPFSLIGGSEYGELLSIGEIWNDELKNRVRKGDILLSANKL